MKHVVKAIPFVLLLSLVPFLFYGDLTIAHAIVLVSISSLVGFQYYLEDKTKPDYVKLFRGEFEAYKKEVNKKYEATDKNYKEIREAYGKYTFNSKKTNSGPDNWTF